MNRFKSIIYLLIVFAFFITACTGTPSPAAVAPDNAQEATQPAADKAPAQQGKVNLQLWGFAGEYEFLPQLIKDFEAENPNITIEITDIPEGDYVTKIDTALLADEPPDLGYMYERRWIKNGSFLSLETFLQQEGINLADYNAGVMSTCTYEGKVYCIGTYTGAVLLYYNKDLFDKAGVSYPSSTVPMTIDDYAVMIKKLSVPSDDIQKRVWGGDAGVADWWIERSTMFSKDGRKIEGLINDAATVHLYEVLSSLPKDGSVMTATEAQLLEGSDLLAQGRLATSIIDNAVAIPTLEKANVRYGAAPPPVEKKGDPAYTPTWTDSYGVFTKSKHPEEAKKFMAYLIKKGNEKQLELGNLSLDLKLAAEKKYGADNEGRMETFEAIKVGALEVIDIPNFWEVVGPIDDGFSQMIEEGKSAKEVLDALAPDMQKTLDQSWETWDSIK
jgi:multiple sugar transport system substrate-binding protein